MYDYSIGKTGILTTLAANARATRDIGFVERTARIPTKSI